MRIVLQRVKHASVTVEGQITGAIQQGFLLLVGVSHEDTLQDAELLASKIAKLRIFNDQDGKMNLSIDQVGGQILSVSQFTLFADWRKGNRPSFIRAAKPEQAKALWEEFNHFLRKQGLDVQTGIFAADMKVELFNDGPVTLILDSKETA
ncbi:D-aminoacyl-tRNA deacylase [Deinococcus cellulosilyticus]|uniref:D-aminoacyl-tRNA deacylase n=1 Tax=Deinococcus cellulosilyticus (strain DSM 18568 / NBRC 106333 / KACC 11606 / 5516J-15) TaxID=1223518 RepID=A0A511NAN1_DEIC1|nr:D-aminoacyl-tRNA deacylase [Deinococcus cellulosilyticus]GEM49882.1 D-aminoacyl-tRNA deacylase [Deinococcus cellulosilyticus NBRC 106333 = KACC 11606]